MSSSKVNIQGTSDIDDMFYRYRMALPIIQKQKNTYCIQNIDLIAKDLGRDPNHIVKYLKKCWATSMIYKNGIGSTTKNINSSIFSDTIRKYIEIYVLCDTCRNPETILVDKKKKLIKECKACSAHSIIDTD
jgi:translation initiation factor 2 subunit 2